MCRNCTFRWGFPSRSTQSGKCTVRCHRDSVLWENSRVPVSAAVSVLVLSMFLDGVWDMECSLSLFPLSPSLRSFSLSSLSLSLSFSLSLSLFLSLSFSLFLYSLSLSLALKNRQKTYFRPGVLSLCTLWLSLNTYNVHMQPHRLYHIINYHIFAVTSTSWPPEMKNWYR